MPLLILAIPHDCVSAMIASPRLPAMMSDPAAFARTAQAEAQLQTAQGETATWLAERRQWEEQHRKQDGQLHALQVRCASRGRLASASAHARASRRVLAALAC